MVSARVILVFVILALAYQQVYCEKSEKAKMSKAKSTKTKSSRSRSNGKLSRRVRNAENNLIEYKTRLENLEKKFMQLEKRVTATEGMFSLILF